MEIINELKKRLTGIIDNFYDSKDEPRTKARAFEPLLKDLSNGLQAYRDKLKKNRTSIFYPKSSHSFTDIKRLGLLERETAQTFMASPRTTKTITEQLKTCFDLNEIDFASVIFEKLNEQIPKSETDWKHLKNTNRDNFDFDKSIESQYKVFKSKNGIDHLNEKIAMLDDLERKTNDFNKQLNNNYKMAEV